MRTMALRHTRVAWRESGGGEAVVAIHSSASSGAQWEALRERLGEGCHLIAPDLYGYGGTDPWHGRGCLSVAHEATLVSTVVARCAGSTPVHLVGHSHGGTVALRLALERPGSVRSLTLIEPLALHLLREGGPDERSLYWEVSQLVTAVRTSVMSGDYCAGMQRFVDYWSGRGTWAGLPPGARQRLARQIGAVALNLWAGIGEPTPFAAYRRLCVPTRVIRGSESPAPVRRVAELLAMALPRAELCTIEGAGHMLPSSHPGPVNDLVEAAVAGRARTSMARAA